MTDQDSRLILTRALDEVHDRRREHARAASRGDETRVIRGAYAPTSLWEAATPREQHLMRLEAVARTRRGRPVFSHESAAVIHGLPLLTAVPDRLHETVNPMSGARSRNGIVRHSAILPVEDVVDVAGMLVTSLSRTVIDLAASMTFAAGVVVADHALYQDRFAARGPLVHREELLQHWRDRLPFRGYARAERVILFAEVAAQTPLESVSRVAMSQVGCPKPRLQVPFYDITGFIGEGDFSWEGSRVIGEADGDTKYLDAASRSGRSAERVFLDEKIREDRLRALGRTVTRWRWNIASRPHALRSQLERAGLVMGAPWSW